MSTQITHYGYDALVNNLVAERDRWQSECGKLTAEVARLRAALEHYANYKVRLNDEIDMTNAFTRVARESLEFKP